MMEEAVLSDSEEAVTIVMNILRDHDHPLSVGIINTAKSRGLVKIIKLLDTDYQDTTDQQKQSLIQAVSDRTASIQGKIRYFIFLVWINTKTLALIPKSSEFDYKDKMKQVLDLIPAEDQGKTVDVDFKKLLTLHKV